eukprot:TRINITY_DN4235_c1_g4_i1.p1 TRINITY_DN4235_c1_g4~~TRINITY_DN4235_c1_g4_i1.p1  ORF type:complete len:148 (+),score=46.58 TRINITY_DN4235_c1_g4_i1:198-641(+)
MTEVQSSLSSSGMRSSQFGYDQQQQQALFLQKQMQKQQFTMISLVWKSGYEQAGKMPAGYGIFSPTYKRMISGQSLQLSQSSGPSTVAVTQQLESLSLSKDQPQQPQQPQQQQQQHNANNTSSPQCQQRVPPYEPHQPQQHQPHPTN